MVKEMLHGRDDVLWLNGDEPDVRNLFDGATSTLLKSIIGNKKIVVIDEAQRISDIGIYIKLIADNIPDIQVIATGSSSFDLSNKINEPLTGRKFEYCMYPLSFAEMVANTGLIEEKRMLQQRLVYGYYPDVVCNAGDERAILSELSNSYLYKDILLLDKIKKSEKLIKLLQALAFQVGSEVSFNELSQICGLDPKTIDTYVSLLEQSYIVFRLGSFSRNLRNELKFSRKIYFWDCGIRKAARRLESARRYVFFNPFRSLYFSVDVSSTPISLTLPLSGWNTTYAGCFLSTKIFGSRPNCTPNCATSICSRASTLPS